jgi:hypothetical protein
MIAVHSILWLTTLGQSNREEFLMVEFKIKLKSCLLETEMMEKKDVLFFPFWFPVRKEEIKGMYQFNIPASTLLWQHGAS